MLEQLQESARQVLLCINEKTTENTQEKAAACSAKAATSCLFALFDKPTSRLRAFLHAVR